MNRNQAGQEGNYSIVGTEKICEKVIKRNGVVYTPEWIVDVILKKTLPKELSNISVCDPSCGDGAFLAKVAERICKQAAASNDADPYIASLNMLTGFDVDSKAINICREKLNQVLSKHLDGVKVDWTLEVIDGIEKKQWTKWRGQFNYVIGNPPYVRVQNLEESRRESIRKSGWKSMSGCTDLYMLFFEYGMELLGDGGSLCYITPNSWMKSSAGQSLRRFIENFNLDYLLDFDSMQVFEGVTTYTSITKLSKGNGKVSRPVVEKWADGKIRRGFHLLRYKDKLICIPKSSLIIHNDCDSVLGDLTEIKVGIQTLADKIFILPVVKEQGKLVLCASGEKKVTLEKDLTRRIFKASVMKNGLDKVNRVVIYPYDGKDGLIPEKELIKRFPHAYQWLLSNKQTLLMRDKGKARNYGWYEYGRGVGIKTGFGKKILTSGMNRSPNFQICHDENSLFYSGYSIKPKPGVNIEKLLVELNSDAMDEYIQSVSKPFLHGWRSYAKSFIQDFPIQSGRVI